VPRVRRDDGRGGCHSTRSGQRTNLLNPGVLALGGCEKGRETGQLFLAASDEIVGRKGIGQLL
jgi:hypothetical protein